MAKLTLSIDDRIVKRAKKYAKQYDVSVSSLVANYLDSLTRPPRVQTDDPPILKEMRGLLQGSKATENDYYKYLEEKYLK